MLQRFHLSAISILLGILILAAAIRIYAITSAPPSYNRDEAAFGYDTYSILKTGRDQHGVFLPTSFKSFGVWEDPVQYYLKLPFIAIFGLNIFSVRLSVVFISIITVLLIYLLAKKLIDETTALLSAFICTFSIYHFYMSRTGFSESMYGLALLLAGSYFLLSARGKYLKLVGGFLLGFSVYAYPGYSFFLPAYFVILVFFFWDKIKKDNFVKLSLGLGLIVLISSYFVFWTPNKLRIPGGAFFYQDNAGIRFKWSDKPTGELLAQGKKYGLRERILYNPRVGFVSKAVENYFDAFSPVFWLENGRGFESNVEGFGNLLLYEPLIIIVGALYLVWKRKREGLFLIGWVLIGPTASMFTKDVASTRLFHMIVPMILLEAVGFIFLFSLVRYLPKISRLPIVVLFLLPIIFYNLLFYDSYFRRFPFVSRTWWDNGYVDIVKFINKYPEKNIYWASRGNMGYIFILFENKYDPLKFQKEAERIPGPLNTEFVTKFSKYNFVDQVDWNNTCGDDNALYISEAKDVPLDFKPDGFIAVPNTPKYAYYVTDSEKCTGAKSPTY